MGWTGCEHEKLDFTQSFHSKKYLKLEISHYKSTIFLVLFNLYDPMEFTIENPLDMHIHFRDNEMKDIVAPLTSKYFSGALVMPNLVPPVMNTADVIGYRERIESVTGKDNFTPFMTLFFHEGLTREILEEAKDHIMWINLYPAGITTNSEWWVKSVLSEKAKEIFGIMQELGIVLHIHGETGDFVMDREANFMPNYLEIAKTFPDLTIIMEHITTKAAADTLDMYPNLYATITLQHLEITLDDVAGWALKPHLFCKPIAKRYEDRDALLELALSGHPKVSFGSDSAPHPQHTKECPGCAAWVFSAPISLQVLTELFEKHGKLDNLEKFISTNAQKIYNIQPNTKTVILEKKDFIVPEKYGDVVPYRAGNTLAWSIKEIITN